MSASFRIIGASLMAFGAFASLSFGQSIKTSKLKKEAGCGQARDVRGPLINEANRDVFTVRRVSFVGNIYTRDRDLRSGKRTLNEGDIFSRRELESSVKNLSRMRAIYPVTMNNIVITLDVPRKDVDIVFCVRERPKR